MKKQANNRVFQQLKWQIKPKMHRYPTRRWGHTSVILKEKLYIYGGKTGKIKQPLYQIDCNTLQSHMLDGHGFPQSRQSHSCNIIKDKLIIWGGCRNQQALNDCMSFTVRDKGCEWSPIPQFPPINARESHVTAAFEDKYILLYGGCKDELIYDDFWVFNTELDVWFQIKDILNKFQKRINCSLQMIGQSFYLFGGQKQDESYENALIKLTLQSYEFVSAQKIPSMTCQVVKTNGKVPQRRSGHGSVVYKDRYMLIIGGQTEMIVKGKKSSVLLNDIWVFDQIQNTWTQLQVANKSIFKPRSYFTVNIHKNNIFIYGGLVSIQKFKSSDQLLVLSFTDKSDTKIYLCNLCKLSTIKPYEAINHKQITDIVSDKSFSLSTRSLYKLAKCIKNPLQAVSLMIEAYNRLLYKVVMIQLVQSKVIVFQGVGVKFKQRYFRNLLKNFEFADQIKFNNDSLSNQQLINKRLCVANANLQIASPRLGKTIIFINKRQNYIDIMLIDPVNAFYCTVETEGYSVSQKQTKIFEIIQKHLIAYNINITLLNDQTFTVVITDLWESFTIEPEITKQSLHKHLQRISIDQTKTKYILNGEKIMRLEYSEIPQQEHTTKEKDSLKILKTRLYINQTGSKTQINVYRDGILIWIYTDNGQIPLQGMIQINSNLYQINTLRTGLNQQSQITLKQQMRQICNNFRTNQGKRVRKHEQQMEVLGQDIIRKKVSQ